MGRQSSNRGAGRPRAVPYVGSLPAREQILDAAARLFVQKGFSATSTREIAEDCGMRQASLYYHFSGKDEILVELLHRSVRPTVDKVEKIEALVPPATHEAALYLLALIDVRTLAAAPHNLGMLARLPEITQCPAYDDYRETRRELVDAYGRLGSSIAQNPIATILGQEKLGELLLSWVDSVINLRVAGDKISPRTAGAIAGSCLRVCGVADDRIELARETAYQLLPGFHDEVPA